MVMLPERRPRSGRSLERSGMAVDASRIGELGLAVLGGVGGLLRRRRRQPLSEIFRALGVAGEHFGQNCPA